MKQFTVFDHAPSVTDYITFPIHGRENNQESQQNLNANRPKFSRQCRTIIEAMLRGEKLTSEVATFNYRIMSPIRRFNDIIEAGVPVRYEWDSDHKYKVMSIDEGKREQVKELVGAY